ncbi:MAG: Nif3-like dinuclear metal center hexameric protein [Planctomycetaceae bacterium]|nr:Nif3-like dinuclear metal center hexameric protein [Planctomycetaceae bacterium]
MADMAATLNTVLDVLDRIAPLSYAAAWDNVGLLLAPARPRRIERMLLTIDLAAPVVDEAIAARASMIVAYHPPIFEPIKRVHGRLAALIERRVAVYSPHTALDAASGGVNDWLAEGLGPGDVGAMESLPATDDLNDCKLVAFVPADHVDRMREQLKGLAGWIGDYRECSFGVTGTGTFRGGPGTHPVVGQANRLERVDEVRLEMSCEGAALPRIEAAIREVHPYEEPAWDVYRLAAKPTTHIGYGRSVALKRPARLATIVQRVKRHLKLSHVRVAAAKGHRRGGTIRNIALCAGAGGSVLGGASADVYLTGEMRHHDVLAAVEAGTSVILCDHTNTERGYLPVLKKKLAAELGRGVRIDVSKRDAEPLRVV